MLCGIMIDFITRIRRLAVIPLAIALTIGLFASGCKSTPKTPSQRQASVIIKDKSQEEIDAVIQSVFEKHGYELYRHQEGPAMVFEKKGSFMNGLMYGDWYSGGVWDRVKVYRAEIEQGQILVDCDDYMVQEHDDPFFQSERKTYKTRGHVYQQMLDEVAKQLVGK